MPATVDRAFKIAITVLSAQPEKFSTFQIMKRTGSVETRLVNHERPR
jgi:hypothetical protein